MNPTLARIRDNQHRDGGLDRSRIAYFRDLYNAPDMKDEFDTWRTHRAARAIRGVLDELALFVPDATFGTSDLMIQHGITLGLQLARQLMTDPSMVYPEMFTGESPVPTVPVPEETYSSRPVIE